MTASMISPFFSDNSATRFYANSTLRVKDFTAQVYDFNGECHQFEVEADNEGDAYEVAADLAASYGIDADYICIYPQA